jgi:hypothetical protein
MAGAGAARIALNVEAHQRRRQMQQLTRVGHAVQGDIERLQPRELRHSFQAPQNIAAEI